jgi:hypothetical protein
MNELRPDLTPLPKQIAKLPISENGYPVPWFVFWVDGKPDFRVTDEGKLVRAVKEKKCWICGRRLVKTMTFVFGPMGVMNRGSMEPPSHYECAEWAARNCPFITRSQASRRENNLPDSTHTIELVSDHNPGVFMLWTTHDYMARLSSGNHHFTVGDPVATKWFTNGHEATREEVIAGIDAAYNRLVVLCTTDALKEQLARHMAAVEPFLPERTK